jgi:threonine synthase
MEYRQEMCGLSFSPPREMFYKSTRGDETNLSFERVLFGTYSRGGGLYVPEQLPTITREMLIQWKQYSFPQICAEILHLFSDIPLEKLNEMTENAYRPFNGGEVPLPMTRIEDNLIFLDASYGPTLAFKDIGQQIVAQLLNYYLSLKQTTAKIIVETSGSYDGMVGSLMIFLLT